MRDIVEDLFKAYVKLDILEEYFTTDEINNLKKEIEELKKAEFL